MGVFLFECTHAPLGTLSTHSNHRYMSYMSLTAEQSELQPLWIVFFTNEND